MTGTHRSNGSSPSTEALERDVERQREQLADTVDALQAKLDVKTRTRDRVSDLKHRATTDSGSPRPPVVAGAVAALAVLAGLVYLRARRR